MGGDCGRLYYNQDGDNDNNRLDQRSDYEREPPPLDPYDQRWSGCLEISEMGRHPVWMIDLWKAAGEEGVDILWRICKQKNRVPASTSANTVHWAI